VADEAEERSEHAPTLRPKPSPVVLLVGGPEALAAAIERVVLAESDAIAIARCELPGASNAVAELRPFAIVVSHEMFEFDPHEFEALARDVGALLVRVKVEGVQRTFLEQAVRPSLRTAFRNWRTGNQSGPVAR
jgi:hypothetical protein